MAAAKLSQFAVPMQVAAVCYRWKPAGREFLGLEFLLVRTRGGSRWTFPKGDVERSLTHSQAAEREAFEEAGVRGVISPKHFHLYLHSKGIFWKPAGVREFMVKAFLLEVREEGHAHESMRQPSWFSAADTRAMLAKGRETKYAREILSVIDKAVSSLTVHAPASS